MSAMNYKLSPSDFAFLYEGCKRCFYLKVIQGISQPSIPLPSVFTKIAGLLKSYYDGKHTSALHRDLPPGTVKYGERYVKSKPIQVNGHNDRCFIRGRFDIVVEFDDRGYGVIDFKTGNPNEEYRPLYARQLLSYAYALENAETGALALSPVTKLGLLYFYPSKISQQNVEWLSYDAQIHWVPVVRNDQDFMDFIGDVLGLLEGPDPPEPSLGCQWCNYVERLKVTVGRRVAQI